MLFNSKYTIARDKIISCHSLNLYVLFDVSGTSQFKHDRNETTEMRGKVVQNEYTIYVFTITKHIFIYVYRAYNELGISSNRTKQMHL
ncbi:hypothetical protein SAMN06265348_10146 [Pedobacter westerhofensis]|uniref:Uncharacterized protein n=1 Tax=Pedobacter westerhofensis TaxID=425512 RepID=A0A521ACU8_9SPHI|nr:hypothetical protein SAMN06265348_10146 [Pedobacter westerhofensis]